jgi:guanylate kinase
MRTRIFGVHAGTAAAREQREIDHGGSATGTRAPGKAAAVGMKDAPATRPRGRLVVVSAPSGAGKTSLVHAAIERDRQTRLSVSHTTRAARPREIEGRDYFFVDPTQFAHMVDQDEFLEHARVFDNFYGTSRAQVETLLAAGHNVILEIDWQGARQVRTRLPEAVTVFILPPSRAELERRLRGRGTDSEAIVARRLADSVGDMSHWDEFGYVIVNDDFETALADLLAVIRGKGERSRADRPGLSKFVHDLLGA